MYLLCISLLLLLLLLFIHFFNRGELISLRDIENIHKKRRHDKESRLETVLVSILAFVFYWVETSRAAPSVRGEMSLTKRHPGPARPPDTSSFGTTFAPLPKLDKVGPFRPLGASVLDLGWGRRDCVFFVLIAILDKVDGKLRPPLPSSQRSVGKWCVLAFARLNH